MVPLVLLRSLARHEHANMLRNSALAVALVIALGGCGGGESSNPSNPQSPSRPSTTSNSSGGVDAYVTAASGVPVGTYLAESKGCSIPYTVSAILGTPNGADPLASQLWHLQNTGALANSVAGEDINVTGAWAITKGQGVRVAVIDRGVELTHEDLAANVVANGSYNYYTKTAWPLPCSDSDSEKHGTEVAGLIAARDNNGRGARGVAPQAGLVAFNPLDLSDTDVANALNRDFNLNAVYNNSWGSADNGFVHNADAAFESAVTNGITNGRNGKGSIIVFSGGNGGYIRLANGVLSSETSNFDGYINKRGIITVCSVDAKGKQSSFSEGGSNLLVCAPSDIGAKGLNTTSLRNSYADDFIGTSGTAPQVSGVAALILAANPDLSWRDVQRIIAQTARKNDPSDSAWATSSNGLHFNYKYGFGVVDASAAVNAARSWVSVGGAATQKQCSSGPINANLSIADARRQGGGVINGVSAVSSTAIPSTCGITEVEFIEIEFSTSHTNPADLRIELVSPSNTRSLMVEPRLCGSFTTSQGANPCQTDFQNARMSSMRHLREPAIGTWNLVLTDESPVDVGRLVSWSIKIWGK